LSAAKIPVLLEPKCKAIEAAVALAVDVVFTKIRMISSFVIWIINLGAHDSGRAFVQDVANLLDCSFVFLVNVAPTLGGAFIAEDLRGLAEA
jgi:hypothetical protein